MLTWEVRPRQNDDEQGSLPLPGSVLEPAFCAIHCAWRGVYSESDKYTAHRDRAVGGFLTGLLTAKLEGYEK